MSEAGMSMLTDPIFFMASLTPPFCTARCPLEGLENLKTDLVRQPILFCPVVKRLHYLGRPKRKEPTRPDHRLSKTVRNGKTLPKQHDKQ